LCGQFVTDVALCGFSICSCLNAEKLEINELETQVLSLISHGIY